MVDYEESVQRISEEIQQYLQDHPNAADTLQGITKWWLANAPVPMPVDHVEKALEWLICHQIIAKGSLPDGGAVFFINKKSLSNNTVES